MFKRRAPAAPAPVAFAPRRRPWPAAVPTLVALALLLSPPLSAPGSLRAQAPDTAAMAREAVRLSTEYLRINTTNPPGQEVRTMRFFARILEKEGIPFDTAVSADGRGNVWARLKGTGNGPALMLLSHMDVVPADTAYWHEPPFAATIRNDTVYARGALDTKTLGIEELEAFRGVGRLLNEGGGAAALRPRPARQGRGRGRVGGAAPYRNAARISASLSRPGHSASNGRSTRGVSTVPSARCMSWPVGSRWRRPVGTSPASWRPRT
ncbi:MAG: M20/M25/M40 family metallo-hydrolase [Candidatus Palauibacterales bacterium]|nr:M20/M25/M40 family metallo-hydrolase [Candidatus Palauibacterales bacterium]